VAKGCQADGGRLAPKAKVRIRSEHHRETPQGYDVFELVPKVFHRWRGDRRDHATHLNAVPNGAADLNSVFWSDTDWELPGPRNQKGEARYQAQFDAASDPRVPVEAFVIRCSTLFIDRLQHSRSASATLAPTVVDAETTASLGTVGGGLGSVTTYRAYAPVDPEVEVSLLQGAELALHLTDMASSFADEHATVGDFQELLRGDTAAYFAGQPLPAAPEPIVRHLGPTKPVEITVGAPASDDLRAAFAVVVTDTGTGATTVSEPLFLTSIRGSIIATDMPLALLSDESTAVLAALDETNRDIGALASIYATTPEAVWDHVVAATVELGAASVDEAAAFAGFTRGTSNRSHAVEVQGPVTGTTAAIEQNLTITLMSGPFTLGEWGALRLRVKNNGPSPLRSLGFAIDGPIRIAAPGTPTRIPDLAVGQAADVSFFISATETGHHVPAQVRASYSDESGRSRTQITRIPLIVNRLSSAEEGSATQDAGQRPDTILFLTIGPPSDTPPLQLDKEMREIQKQFQLEKYRNSFRLESAYAVRLRDITEALLDYDPRIVRIAGHGRRDGSLYVEDEMGNSVPVPAADLATLIALHAHTIDGVILNASDTPMLAEALAPHINHVISLRSGLSDSAAIAFSIGFYQGLAAGAPVPDAFERGLAFLQLSPPGGRPEDGMPVLLGSNSR
jgi:hypothetical protein